jgi:hypothetical protein
VAYDLALAERIRSLVAGRPGVTEKEMFGGLAFLSEEQMFCCVLGRELLARVGVEHEAGAKARPHARSLNLIGYAMSGCVLVAPAGLASELALRSWVDECAAQAAGARETAPHRAKASARHKGRRTGSRRP